jgi:hypothetical protein
VSEEIIQELLVQNFQKRAREDVLQRIRAVSGGRGKLTFQLPQGNVEVDVIEEGDQFVFIFPSGAFARIDQEALLGRFH